MMLSGSLECATFTRLPDRIMDIPHPGVLEAYTGGRIPLLDLEAGARLQMLSPVELLGIWTHAIIRSKHCGANEGKQIVFPSEGCRREGCKSVPSSFATEHLGTGLIMGESACSVNMGLQACGCAAGLPS